MASLSDRFPENVSDHLARWKDALLGAVFGRPLWKMVLTSGWVETLQAVTATLGADGRICGCLHDDGAGAGLIVSLAELSGVGKRETWFHAQRSVRDTVDAGLPSRWRSDSANSRQGHPSWQSDDAEAACLRSSWSPASSVATLTFHQDPVGIELVADGTPLLVGPQGLSLREDGEEVEIEDAWECICWYTDGEVDYCELQLEFDDGSKLGRFIMLPRGRQFAVIADIASGSTAKQLELTSETAAC